MKQIMTFLFLLSVAFVNATIINVPADQTTIQEGVDFASPGDTVLVAPGIYYECIDIEHDVVVGSYFITTADTTFIDSTIVDGYTNGIVFDINGSGALNSVITGLTIRNGIGYYAAGIEIWFSGATISHNVITSNTCTENTNGGGGGISLWHSGATICNNKIIGNESYGKGGGIWIDNLGSSSNFTISNNLIENNNGTLGGGGIACIDLLPAECVISNNIFRTNTANDFGGGIYCDNSSPLIQENTLVANTSVVFGAGIYCTNNANPIIDNNYFSGIQSFCSGAAITCTNNSNVEIKGNIFTDFSVSSLIKESSSSSVFLQNNTFYNNLILGAVIECEDPDAIIENNIMMANDGVAINSSNPNVTIAYNDFYDQPEPLFSGSLPPDLGLLSQTNVNGDSCDVYSNIFLDPLLIDPVNYDFHLTEYSPCIDAGDQASPLDPDSTIADIGAYYFDQTTSLAPPQNVTVEIIGTEIHLSWDAVIGATSYKIYSSDDPFTGFTEDTTGTLAGESWSTDLVNEKKFYYVIAIN